MQTQDIINYVLASTSVLTAIATAFVAYLTYKVADATKGAVAGDFLLRLDKALRQHQDVHTRLRPGGDWSRVGPGGEWRKEVSGPEFPKDGPAIESYMGLFERIRLLVEEGVIDIGTVDRLYGYRLSNIVSNPIIFQKKLVELADGWTDFIKLWGELAGYRKKSRPDSEQIDPLVQTYTLWLSRMKQ